MGQGTGGAPSLKRVCRASSGLMAVQRAARGREVGRQGELLYCSREGAFRWMDRHWWQAEDWLLGREHSSLGQCNSYIMLSPNRPTRPIRSSSRDVRPYLVV